MRSKGVDVRKQYGFSLIELLIVIAVIGLSVGVATPRTLRYDPGPKKWESQ